MPKPLPYGTKRASLTLLRREGVKFYVQCDCGTRLWIWKTAFGRCAISCGCHRRLRYLKDSEIAC